MYTHHNVRSATIAIVATLFLIVPFALSANASAETYPVSPVQFTDGATHARGFTMQPSTSARLLCAPTETTVGYDAATFSVRNPTMSERTAGVFTIRANGNARVVFAPNGYVANIGSQRVAVEVLCEVTPQGIAKTVIDSLDW